MDAQILLKKVTGQSKFPLEVHKAIPGLME